MADEFIRVPPDSSGKRVHTEAHSVLFYTGGLFAFDTHQIVTGATSGATGTVYQVIGDTASGKIFLKKPNGDETPFILGEDLEVGAVKFAEVSIIDAEVNDQVVLIGGGNNSHNTTFVDDRGAMYIRYADGEQQLDAFGLTRSSQPTILGEYSLTYDDMPDEHTTSISGTASSTYDFNSSSVVLSVGTSNGDQVIRATNRYHAYQPGFSQYILMTVVAGDAGKTNLHRRWGCFDGYNGIYFEQDNTTLYAVIRSNSSGSVVETRIPQTSWNGDLLDGTGGLSNLSKINLDITTMNLYWIDFAWLGTGRVRFGIFNPDGTRVVAHTIENGNSNVLPYMGKATLPICFEQENTGSTISTSEMRIVCASIQTEGRIPTVRDRRSQKTTALTASDKVVYDGYEIPVGSIRSAKTYKGQINRTLGLPERFSFYVKDNPVIVKIVKNAALAGDTFIQANGSAGEVDGYATSLSGGRDIYTWMLEPGASNFDSPSNFGYYSENITLNADGKYGDTYTLSARCLVSGATAKVTSALTWIDVG